jgi:hypothetical protein
LRLQLGRLIHGLFVGVLMATALEWTNLWLEALLSAATPSPCLRRAYRPQRPSTAYPLAPRAVRLNPTRIPNDAVMVFVTRRVLSPAIQDLQG